MNEKDTIFAQASGFGKAGVSIIRISGKKSLEIANTFLNESDKLSIPNYLKKASITSPICNNLIDIGMAVYFKAPHSFTGEDVVEFHLHGSRAIVTKVLQDLAKCSARLALPGEFSKRAFLNEKMDLVQAEGLAQLIASETEEQRKLALSHMTGNASNYFMNLRHDLISLRAYVEALIDFPDEDIAGDEITLLFSKLDTIKQSLSKAIKSFSISEKINSGVKVAIIGKPNSGKSSLLNYLAKRDIAIVSDIPGTTRDVIEVALNINGIPFVVFDTAGIRDSTDIIESEGIRRAINIANDSDIIIHLLDAASNDDQLELSLPRSKTYRLYNKVDLLNTVPADNIYISVMNEINMNKVDDILTEFAQSFSYQTNDLTVATIRQKLHLERAFNFANEISNDHTPEIIAEYIKYALDDISIIVGEVHLEDVLDVLFGEFCIGK